MIESAYLCLLERVYGMAPQQMSVYEFRLLDQDEQARWGRRLVNQWNTLPIDTAEFWYVGDRIIRVTKYKRNAWGNVYLEGERVAIEVLGEL